MKKGMPLAALIIVILAAGALGYWWWHRSTPQARLHKRLAALEEVVSKSPKEGNSLMVLKMQRLEAMVADPCEVVTDRYGMAGSYSPEELVSMAMRVRQMMSEVRFKLFDVSITKLTEQEAEVHATARFTALEENRGQEETAEVILTLKMVDGKWRFEQFEEVPVFER